MPDFNKLNIRFTNLGLNIEHTPSSLEFGKYTVLKNAWSQFEGEITSRRGIVAQSSNAITGAIIGIQQLNDWINNLFTYIVKSTNGKWYFSTSDGTHVSTVAPFQFADTGAAAGASIFGSIVVDRPPLSAQAWAYIGDGNFHLKMGIQANGTLVVKNQGITRPLSNTQPALTQSAGGNLTALATYYYRYTLYDKNTGVESLFNTSDNTTGITLTGGNQTVNVVVPTETIDTAVTHVRVYRLGGTINTWNRISDDSATYAYTGTTINFNDSNADVNIVASTLLDTISDKPFTITKPDGSVVVGAPVKYMFGPYLGYILAVGDIYNPGYVYWTNKFQPDMQTPANNIEVTSPQDPLQNGFVYDGKPFVFSKESLYALYAGVSATSAFVPSKTACGRGLWAPHAFCVGPQVFFLSKDGIYATSGGLEQALTDNELRPIFDPKQTATSINGIGVLDYTQVNYMFMSYYKQEIFFQYFGKDGNTNLLIYDLRYRRWRHMIGNGPGATIRCMYNDTQTPANIVFGGNDGFQYQESGLLFTDAGLSILGEMKTGLITMDTPLIHKEWGALVLDVNPNNATVTVNAYSNHGTTLVATGASNNGGRVRLFVDLNDTFSEDLQLDFVWTTFGGNPIFYGYELFYRPDVPSMNKWYVNGVTHDILGWQILRSGYITLVSDGQVTLTITTLYDGSTLTFNYTIPSTLGVRRKMFIPFDPIKGKIFNYTLSISGIGGASFFRFYPEESEVHVKPWISSFGYRTFNPFKAGGEMPTGYSGQQTRMSGGDGPALGGGGGGYGADLAAMATTPLFQYSGVGGGSPLGPAGTANSDANIPDSAVSDAVPGAQSNRDNAGISGPAKAPSGNTN